jgi:hypothetical protein
VLAYIAGTPARLADLSGKKLGVSARQLAGEEPTVVGRFNHAPGRDREARAEPTCYKVLPFLLYTLGYTLLIYRGSRRGVCIRGSHHLELVTRSMALDGREINPAVKLQALVGAPPGTLL